MNGNYVYSKRTIQVVESKSALEYLAGIERDTVDSTVTITVYRIEMIIDKIKCVISTLRVYMRACMYTSVELRVPVCNRSQIFYYYQIFVLVCCYNCIPEKGGPKIIRSEILETTFPVLFFFSGFNQLVDFNVGVNKWGHG